MRGVVATVVLLLAIVPLTAQETAEFLERARRATAKYRDQSGAINDGYRRIGRDFPGMGEHWIRINLLFDGKIEAERPELLTYVDVSGSPVLLGVAYALPLLPGEAPPAYPAPKEAWHDHLRTVEDETVLPHHHLPGAAGDTPRLAMLHAWIWTSNPEGVFAADNWAIPYLRLGMPIPQSLSLPAARALSLLTGGAEYFSMSIEAAVSPNTREQAAIRAAFARTRSLVEERVRRNNLDALGDLWNELSSSIEAAVTPEARPRLRTLLR